MVAPYHQVKPIPAVPLQSTYYHRCFTKFADITEAKLKAFANGLNRLEKWKADKAAKREELRIIDNRPEEV
jgi:hypothetical protein